MDDTGRGQTVLGKWLRHARGTRSQAEVAARIDMEQAEWSMWETGKRRRPKPYQIADFALAVGVSTASVALAYAGIWPEDVTTQERPEEVRVLDAVADLAEILDSQVRRTILDFLEARYGRQAAADVGGRLDEPRRIA
jgi:transcriptional regulator with XRE-family HTH domain